MMLQGKREKENKGYVVQLYPPPSKGKGQRTKRLLYATDCPLTAPPLNMLRRRVVHPSSRPPCQRGKVKTALGGSLGLLRGRLLSVSSLRARFRLVVREELVEQLGLPQLEVARGDVAVIHTEDRVDVVHRLRAHVRELLDLGRNVLDIAGTAERRGERVKPVAEELVEGGVSGALRWSAVAAVKRTAEGEAAVGKGGRRRG